MKKVSYLDQAEIAVGGHLLGPKAGSIQIHEYEHTACKNANTLCNVCKDRTLDSA